MSSKVRALARGSILRVIEFFGNVVVGLILMPFIIHSLGDRMYGLWVFVGSFLGYYGLMDFGLNSAIQRFISRAIGQRDHVEANRVINTALVIFAIIGLVALVISFAVAFSIPLLVKNITEIDIFRKLILILGLNFAIGFPLRVFSGILTANIRYDINTSIELAKLIIRTIAIIFFLKSGYDIMALAIITFIMDIGSYVAKYFVVRYSCSYVVLSKSFIDFTKIRPLFSYSIYTFIAQIADQLRFNVDNFVIVTFLGLSFVTVYSIAARLMRYFGQFIMSALGMMSPVFSQYEGVGDYDSIREKFIFMTKISGFTAIFLGISLIMLGKAFIVRWVGEEYSYSYVLFFVMMVPGIIGGMQGPSVQLLYGVSKHKFYAISNSIEGIANLILSLILVKKWA